MAVACVFMPRFALGCELVQHPELNTQTSTVAVVNDRIVQEISPAAGRYGVRPGQRLQEAFSFCPYLVTFEARSALYEGQIASILNNLEQVSPAVETGPLGIIFVDLYGLDRHYSEPGSLKKALLACVPESLGARLGIGTGKFPALVAAQRARRGEMCQVPPKDAAAFLSPTSIDSLSISYDTKRRLRLLGLKTLGALAELPRSSVAMQFGREGTLAWDLAIGHDPDPVRYRLNVEVIPVQQSFEPPLVSREVILAVTEQLLSSASNDLAQQCRAARQVLLQAVTDRGQNWQQHITFKEPRGDQSSFWAAIKPVMEAADLPGPVIELKLQLNGLTALGGFQSTLSADEGKRQQRRLHAALRQLKSRYGYCPVGHVVKVEPWSRIPERRAAIIAFDP